jgi:hypothetical protein
MTVSTQPFNEHAGVVYVAGSKRPISDSAEQGGKKFGNIKKGGQFTAISGYTNKAGEIRIRMSKGWVTARMADGTRLCKVVPAAPAAGSENAENPTAIARRPRSMTVALGERKATMQNVFETAGTPTKAALKCANQGKVVPRPAEIAALIAQLRSTNATLGVKKMAVQIQQEHPVWAVGCREVRASLRAVEA